MEPYDALSWYEQDLDRQAEAQYYGYNSWDEYKMAKSDEAYEKLINEERLFNGYAR